MKPFVALVISLYAAVSSAGVYKCTVDGRTMFSQFPCAEESEEVNVRYHKPKTAVAEEVKPVGQTSVDQHKEAGVNKYIDERKAKRWLKDRERYRAKLAAECHSTITTYTRAANATNLVSRAAYFTAKANEARLQCEKPLERADAAVAAARMDLREIEERENY